LDSTVDHDAEQLWGAEAQRPYQAYLKGESKLTPAMKLWRERAKG
jgi:hypothetical protein